MSVVQTLEWEGRRVRLVKLGGLPTAHQPPARVRGRAVRRLIISQSDATPQEPGLAGVLELVLHQLAPMAFATDPRGDVIFRDDALVWTGGGQAYRGAHAHFCVPALPEVVEGRCIVYRLQDDDIELEPDGSVLVTLLGSYASRWDPRTEARHPDLGAFTALEELVQSYLLPHYTTRRRDLLGGFDTGVPSSPGDFVEQWIRHVRGECFGDPRDSLTLGDARGEKDPRPLRTPRERQTALVELGYTLGARGIVGTWTLEARSALMAFQASHGCVMDGRWGPHTEAALRAALNDRGR